MFNPFLSKDDKEKLEAIAVEKRNIGFAMKTLVGDENFKKVFIDFRGEFIKTCRQALENAIVQENEEATAEAIKDLRRLKSIDWFIKYVSDYYDIAIGELAILEEGEDYDEV